MDSISLQIETSGLRTSGLVYNGVISSANENAITFKAKQDEMRKKNLYAPSYRFFIFGQSGASLTIAA